MGNKQQKQEQLQQQQSPQQSPYIIERFSTFSRCDVNPPRYC